MRAHRSIPLVALALALSGCFGTVRGRVSYGATVTADVRVPAEVIVSTPPPPIRAEVETVTAQPVPHAVWVSGHYEWRGRWVWVPGHWEHDREGYVWVAPVARRHGNRIIYHAGYWVRVGHEPPRVYREPSVVVVAVPPPAGVVVRPAPGRRPPPVVHPVRPRPPVVVQPAPRPPVVVQPAPVQPTRPPVVQPEPVRPPVVVRPAPAPRPPVVRPEPVQPPPRGAVVVRPTPQENPEPPRGAVVVRPEPVQPPRAAVQPPAQPVGPAPPRGPIVRPPSAQTAPVPPNANVQVVPPRTPTVRGPAGQEGAAVAPPRVAPVPAQTGSITCAVDAARAPQGGIVEITGTGFGASARVRIAGRLVRTVQQSEGRILVRVPDQIGGGRVTIVDGDRTGSCGVISLH